MNLDQHLAFINKKVEFQSCKLCPVRKKLDMKLSRNLFWVFVQPLYRLAYALTSGDKRNANAVIKHISIKFKSFCLLPMLCKLVYSSKCQIHYKVTCNTHLRSNTSMT